MAFLFIVAYPEVSRRLVLVRTGRGAAGAWRAGGVGWDEAPLGTAAPKTLRPGRKLSVGRSGKSRAAVPLPPGWGAWALTTREQPPGEPQAPSGSPGAHGAPPARASGTPKGNECEEPGSPAAGRAGARSPCPALPCPGARSARELVRLRASGGTGPARAAFSPRCPAPPSGTPGTAAASRTGRCPRPAWPHSTWTACLPGSGSACSAVGGTRQQVSRADTAPGRPPSPSPDTDGAAAEARVLGACPKLLLPSGVLGAPPGPTWRPPHGCTADRRILRPASVQCRLLASLCLSDLDGLRLQGRSRGLLGTSLHCPDAAASACSAALEAALAGRAHVERHPRVCRASVGRKERSPRWATPAGPAQPPAGSRALPFRRAWPTAPRTRACRAATSPRSSSCPWCRR